MVTPVPSRGIWTSDFVKTDLQKSTDRHILFLTRSRLTTGCRFALNALSVSIMLAPIIILYQTQEQTTRLWVISLFTSLFSSFLAFSTKSRTSEIFAATAT